MTREDFLAVMSYDPETGLFRWISDGGPRARAGGIVGTDHNGYRRVRIGRKSYMLHRVAALIMTGAWPSRRLDHRNGVRSDNRWKNLREAGRSGNAQNAKLRADSSTGFKGVRLRENGKFGARIRADGKRINLGTFETASGAADAYKSAALRLHGEFARVA